MGDYGPNYYFQVGNDTENIIYIDSFFENLDIDGFCSVDAKYIIVVHHFASQHIRLNCENSTTSIYIEHESEYNLQLTRSSEVVMNNAVLSDIAFDISLAQGEFPLSVEFCIPVGRQVDKEDACLGFWDESKSPPEWRCEDRCLKKKNDRTLCGKTEHFTNFAILLSGIDNPCGSDNYVTGSLKGDMLLIWLLIGLFILIWALLMVFCRNKAIRSFFVGQESERIRTLRESHRSLKNASQYSGKI